MLKPVFIDNGMSYEYAGVDTCLLMEEKYITELLNYFETIHNYNYKLKYRDDMTKLNHIIVTEAMIYEYLKYRNIPYYIYNVQDTFIGVD